jgi:hypothetical protein
MTFLQALYGSQYQEINLQGKDGNKGRLNGNIFLSAFIILVLLDSLILVRLLPGMDTLISKSLTDIFGYGNGKTAGKLLAIPLLAIIYFVVSRTVGSEANFKMHVENFLRLPIEEKKQANKKLLLPFLILLGVLFGSSMISMLNG